MEFGALGNGEAIQVKPNPWSRYDSKSYTYFEAFLYFSPMPKNNIFLCH